MITLSISEDLEVSPDVVWAALADFNSYESWHPFATVTGSPVEGTKIDLTLTTVNWQALRTYVATVERVEEQNALTIRLGYRFLLLVRSFHTLEAIHAGTRLTHTVTLSGLVPSYRGQALRESIMPFLAVPMSKLKRHLTLGTKGKVLDAKPLLTNRKARRRREAVRGWRAKAPPAKP